MTKPKADPFRNWLRSEMMSGRAVAALSLRLGVSGASLYNWRKGGGVDLRTVPLVLREAAKVGVTLEPSDLLPTRKP